MRTRYSYLPNQFAQSESSYYTDVTTGAVTPRTRSVWVPPVYTPVYIPGHWEYVADPRTFHSRRINYPESFEAASDLGEGNTMGHWNPFEHYKRLIGTSNLGSVTNGTWYNLASAQYFDTIFCMSPDLIYDGTSRPFGSSSAPFNGLTLLYSPSASGFIPTAAGVAELKSASLKAMLPGIRPNLSLVNSVIELKDFAWVRKMARQVLSRNGQLQLLSRFTRFYRRYKTLRQILGGGSNGYLQYKFNLAPLLSDICGIRRALETARHEVNKLLDNEAKPLTRHWYAPLGSPYTVTPARETVTGLSPSGCELSLDGIAFGPARLSGTVVAYRSTRWLQAMFHSEIQYSYFLSSYERENAILLGFLDSLGVNINPAIIWNAIPWSFVIDWVVGVSRWLDQFKERNLDPLTIIHRCLWSTSIAREVAVDVKFNVNYPQLPQGETRAVTVTEHAYKRMPFTITSQDLTTSGVSLTEFSLASALALSRRGRVS